MKTQKILIIVDIQNDFLEGGSLAVPNGKDIIPGVNSILKNYDLVIATQDSHPKEHKSFASSHNKKIGDIVKLGNTDQFLWPDHCTKGTAGEELSSELDIAKINKFIKKGENPNIDSYSGFLDNDGETHTALHDFLQEQREWPPTNC